MASTQAPDIKTRFEELSAGAQLDILVPTSTDFDPTTLFHDGLPGRLSSAPSRRNLYFDETTQLSLILRTSLGERAVRNLLASSEIVLGAHATDAVPQGHGNAASASGKHDLTSKKIPGLELANVLFAGEQTYIIWKPTLHISRLRTRLHRPAVYFTASLSLTSGALNGARSGRGDLLKSFEPLPGNVLEPLQFDPALSTSGVHLPEDRITKVLPTAATAKDDVKPIRGATKRAFPVVPALYTRVRYSTLSGAVVACVHLEASQLIHGSVTLGEVDLNVDGADVSHVRSTTESHNLLAGDETIRLYNLKPIAQPTTATGSAVSARVQATANIDQSSSVELDISWQAQVDLTKTAMKPTYKWSRPLSSGPLQPPLRLSLQAGARPSSSDLNRTTETGEFGMIFNFTMRTVVNIGDEFSLDAHCINRSSRARRFALVVLHPKRLHASRVQRDSSMEKADMIARIYNAPPLVRSTQPGVLDLNPDVRIGPLPAGAVFETQMKFRAVVSGPLNLGVIRIVDLDTRQTVDVRELPDFIALKPGEE